MMLGTLVGVRRVRRAGGKGVGRSGGKEKYRVQI